jgi:hypothetical protein
MKLLHHLTVQTRIIGVFKVSWGLWKLVSLGVLGGLHPSTIGHAGTADQQFVPVTILLFTLRTRYRRTRKDTHSALTNLLTISKVLVTKVFFCGLPLAVKQE